MAFQQPVQPVSRPRPSFTDAPISSGREEKEPGEDWAREWVLFSPSTPSTLGDHISSAEHNPYTTSLSQRSGRESAHTIVAPSEDGSAAQVPLTSLEGRGLSARDEDEELDSLDTHLHAFRETSTPTAPDQAYDNIALLPTHDGFGSFMALAGRGPNQADQHGDRDRGELPKIRSGMLDTVASREDEEVETARAIRIEAWRLEQSMITLERVEKEIQRRAVSVVGWASPANEGETTPRVGNAERTDRSSGQKDDGIGDVKDYLDIRGEPNQRLDMDPGDRSLVGRLVRRVLKDVIGIDEPLLSIVLGESLPDDEDVSESSIFPEYGNSGGHVDAPDLQISWLNRLLERIAHELDVLAHKMTEQTGAFSTYSVSRPSDVSTKYRSSRDIELIKQRPSSHRQLSVSDLRRVRSGTSRPSSDADMVTPGFYPSLPAEATRPHSHVLNQTTQDAPIPAFSSSSELNDSIGKGGTEAEYLQAECEYWQRTPDLPMLFSYLRHRFRRRPHVLSSVTNSVPAPASGLVSDSCLDSTQVSSPTLASSSNTPSPPLLPRPFPVTSNHSTTIKNPTSQSPLVQRPWQTAARAAVIRHHHPLVPFRSSSGQRPQDRHQSQAGQIQDLPEQGSLYSSYTAQWLKRMGSSCGSESAKSKRAKADSEVGSIGVGGGGSTSVGIAGVGGSSGAGSMGLLASNDEMSNRSDDDDDLDGEDGENGARNYWDLGSRSVGSHSFKAAAAAAATTGPLGAWVDI